MKLSSNEFVVVNDARGCSQFSERLCSGREEFRVVELKVTGFAVGGSKRRAAVSGESDPIERRKPGLSTR